MIRMIVSLVSPWTDVLLAFGWKTCKNRLLHRFCSARQIVCFEK